LPRLIASSSVPCANSVALYAARSGEFGHGGREHLGHGDGPLVGLGTGHGQAQLHEVLRDRRPAHTGHQAKGCHGGKRLTAVEFGYHLFLPE
jgi:hypothetical protein